MPHHYRSQLLDHLGLVAGMFDALGIGEVIDRATQQHPATRIVTTGQAVQAMVLNGLGLVNQQLYLVPRFFQDTPLARLFAPLLIEAKHLNDDTLGRALDTLYASAVTALYSLIAATAAQRLALAPTCAHLDTTSFHVDGRYNSEAAPEAEVLHIPRGSSRDHRPDRNQVLLELIVEHQAGLPILLTPLSGHSRDAQEVGHVVREHIAQLHATSGTPYLVADSALYSAETLRQLAETPLQWMTRVPATVRDAQAALAQADPQTMAPLTEGYRFQVLPSTYGGVQQRWVLFSAAPRHPQAQRTVAKQLLKHSDKEGKACKKLCGTPFACEADAQHALAPLAQGLQATCLPASTVCSTPHEGQRGRPSQSAPPAHVVDHIAGALASSLAAHQALVDPQSCVILATNALAETRLSPQAL